MSDEIRETVFRDVPEEVRAKALGPELAAFSEHLYEGWYDTDETIPASYFHLEVARPVDLSMVPLYFTYLHSFTDADYGSMGLGEGLFAPDGDDEGAGADTKDFET